MTNTQLWLAIGLPTLAILGSILQNQLNQTHLSARLAAIEVRISSVEGRLNVIESDLRRFWQILGEYGARIEALHK